MSLYNAKYKEITEILRNEILDGRYSASRAFPSVTRLKRRFSISHLTAVKVLDVLKKEGLVASRQGAGSFVTRRRCVIGLIVPGIAYSEYFPQIASEVSRLSQQEGYGLLFGDAFSPDPVRRAEQAKTLARDFVDKGATGVLFHPLEFFDDAAHVNGEIAEIFAAAEIPVVLVDCDIVPSPRRSDYDVVGVDNFEAGRRLADHLLACGARRVHFLVYPNSSPSGRDRMAGAKSVLFEAGACPSKNTFVCGIGELGDVAAVRAYVKRYRPDAFICANDTGAAYLMSALLQIGKRVPEDVLVTGFDDVQHAKIVTPQITTIHQPCTDIAAQAFRALQERLKNPRLPPREIYLSAPLVVRSSTGNRKARFQNA